MGKKADGLEVFLTDKTLQKKYPRQHRLIEGGFGSGYVSISGLTDCNYKNPGREPSWDLADFRAHLADDFIQRMQKIVDEAQSEGPAIIVEHSDYEGGHSYRIVGTRPETDKQWFARAEKAMGMEAKQVESQRKQYEALKKKFEKGGDE